MGMSFFNGAASCGEGPYSTAAACSARALPRLPL